MLIIIKENIEENAFVQVEKSNYTNNKNILNITQYKLRSEHKHNSKNPSIKNPITILKNKRDLNLSLTFLNLKYNIN
jgi:hypothetical protein